MVTIHHGIVVQIHGEVRILDPDTLSIRIAVEIIDHVVPGPDCSAAGSIQSNAVVPRIRGGGYPADDAVGNAVGAGSRTIEIFHTINVVGIYGGDPDLQTVHADMVRNDPQGRLIGNFQPIRPSGPHTGMPLACAHLRR